jgi:hypothetical protein
MLPLTYYIYTLLQCFGQVNKPGKGCAGIFSEWAHFFASQKNQAIRSNLFYRAAVKKDFHFYPLRGPGVAKRAGKPLAFGSRNRAELP